jgi:hypothetical protein
MRKQVSLLATAAVALLGAVSSAQAYVVLTIADTGTGASVSCDLTGWTIASGAGFCGAGFNIVNANNVSFAGTVGNHSVSTTSGTGNAPGNPVFANLDTSTTSVTRTAAGAGGLQISIVGFDYSQPVDPIKTFSGSASLTSSTGLFAPTDTVNSEFWVDGSNGGGFVNGLSCMMNVSTNTSCNAGSLLWSDGAPAQFSIRARQTYTVAAFGTVNATSSAIVTRIPEPATLGLVGLALLGAGFASRRAAKKA